MRNDVRYSGIDIIGNVQWGTHFCQFYQTKADLMDILIPYLKSGLENNELCIWIMSQFQEMDSAKEALKVGIPYLDFYLENGQIELISYADWYLKNNVFDSYRALNCLVEKSNKSLSSGYDGLRLIEDIFCLEKESWKSDLVNYEKMVDSATGKYPIIALCTYAVDTCNAASILDIIANHQFVLSKKEGKWEQIVSSQRKNITEFMRTEQAQSESEKRYRMLFTNMTDGFGLVEVIYDRENQPYDYRFLEINPAYELILGIERAQLLGKTMLETFPNVSPIAIEKYGEAALSGQPIHFEIFSQVASKYLDIYVFSPEKGNLALILRDITERKQLEEQTRMRAEEMEKIMDVVPIPILIGHDPQGHNITGNRMANEFYEAEMGGNISPSATQAHRYFFKGRELLTNELPIQQAALKDMDVRNVEVDVLFPNGEWRIVLASASPLHDAEGHVRSSVGAFIDITKRKEAETKLKETLDNLENLVKERTVELEKACKSLKESERGLAEAQKMAHIGNWEWDIENDIAYWSGELYRIFKRNPSESAPSYNEYLNYIHPDDRVRFDNSVKETLKGKTPVTEDEHRIVLADGEERTVHMEVEVIFDERNIPVKVKGIIQDITERKQMEETLRQSEKLLSALLEQLPVGIGLADPHGRWLVSNTMLRRFVGDRIPSLDPENKQHWKTWGADGRLLKESQWPSMRALRGEHVTPGLDFLYTSDDGKEIWMRVSSVPFRNEAGEIKGVISIIQDIDEQKRAEEALEIIEKIRIKEIHHRIKNNLQVISSLLDLQAETFSSHEVCKVPEVLEAFMESQNRVISMALIHEELYKGDKIDTLDFSAYLKKLTADLFSSYNLGDKDISLKLNLDQIYLGMDTAIPLGIIVNELVSNSFKHAFPERRRKGEIQISLCRIEDAIAKNEISSPDKDCLQKRGFEYILTVADNGKGIPEEIDFLNSGSLGLQLVNILVEQIDGYIKLKRDNGTKFIIWFNNIES